MINIKNYKLLFIIIWIVHILIYYETVFITAYIKGSIFNGDFFSILAFCPIIGVIGFVDSLPFFVFISIIIMAILVKTCYKKKWFLAYVLSFFPLYPVSYFIAAFSYRGNAFLKSLLDWNIKEFDGNRFYIIIISSIITIITNWLLFKKAYLRIRKATDTK